MTNALNPFLAYHVSKRQISNLATRVLETLDQAWFLDPGIHDRGHCLADGRVRVTQELQDLARLDRFEFSAGPEEDGALVQHVVRLAHSSKEVCCVLAADVHQRTDQPRDLVQVLWRTLDGDREQGDCLLAEKQKLA